MFLLNLGARKTITGQPHGVIHNVSQVPSKILACRPNFDSEMPAGVFVDPELYLHSILDSAQHSNICSNLVSFPWIPGQAPEFKDKEMTLIEWRQELRQSFHWDPNLPGDDDTISTLVESCFDFEVSKGVSALISPAPLIENPEDQLGQQMKWLDLALDMGGGYQLPIYATVALLDELLIHSEPESNNVLQAIVDNIGVRDRIAGINLLVVRSRTSDVRIADKRIVKSLLVLSNEFGATLGLDVLVNFADDLGLFCLAAGAKFFGSGFWRKQRQVHGENYIDTTGGRRFPHLYSARLLADLRSRDDLGAFLDANITYLLDGEYTEGSKELLDALKKGRSSDEVPAWVQSPNNDAAACLHRVQRLTLAAEEMNNSEDKLGLALRWLQNAEMVATYLAHRCQESQFLGNLKHVGVWRTAFEEFAETMD